MVIYPFLWSWEAESGQTEATKKRPCMVAMRIERKDSDPCAILIPITTRPIGNRKGYVAIPQSEVRKVGLNGMRSQGLIMQDINVENLSNPKGLSPLLHVREFSIGFSKEVTDCLRGEIDRNAVRMVARYNLEPEEATPECGYGP